MRQYDVYVMPKWGSIGITVHEHQIQMVKTRANGAIHERKTIPVHELTSKVREWANKGYVKQPRPKYLRIEADSEGVEYANFVDKHPELSVPEGVVLYTTVSNADNKSEFSQNWSMALEKTTISPEILDLWLKRVQCAVDYIVAPSSHPAFALIVAQWALQERRLVLAERPGMPTVSPQRSPIEWKIWLQATFDAGPINSALSDLGWTVGALLMQAKAESITNDVQTGWTADLTTLTF